MHSLPRYYGYLAAIFTVLPGLALLILWSLAEPVILKNSTVNTLSTELQALPPGELDLVLNDIKNKATGGISQSQDDPIREAAALHYSETKARSSLFKTIAVILACLAGAFIGLKKIHPGVRARVTVERAIMVALIICSCIAIFTTIGIVLSVLFESLRFFNKVPFSDFVLGLHWSPQTSIRTDQVGSSGSFGAVPIFAGTLLISFIAMLVAVPFGLMSAIYLAEYASSTVRAWAKPLLEILAGIPTVVYGFFAALTVAPLIRNAGESMDLHPPSIASSTNASRVPDVGGGPITSMSISGRSGFISDHCWYGLAISSSPPSGSGTSLASARKISLRLISSTSDSTEFASVMPSKPINTSIISVTPFAAQLSNSPFLMRRELLVMSGCSTPTPLQNNFMPPPDPVDSILGVLKRVVWPNRSATTVANGKTVEDPTMLI